MTQLLDSPRKVALERLYNDVLTVDASDMIWALMGTAMHTILERGGIDAAGMIEERLYTEIDGCRISGQFDYMDSDGIIWDWKLASVWEVMNGVKEAREEQLNAYAYLASRNSISVKGLRVGFILRDWSPTELLRTAGYPPHQVFVHTVSLNLLEDTELSLKERVALHRAAALSLPECTDKERWAKKETYAVLKGYAKRASRVYPDEDSAQAFAESRNDLSGRSAYRVERRPGNSIRCQSYCSVSSYCEQWKGLRR